MQASAFIQLSKRKPGLEMHPGAMLQLIYSTKGIPDRHSAWVRGTVCLPNRCCQVPAASPLHYCMIDFGSMKRPQANLNTHITKKSPKIVAVGGVLSLLCKSHGSTEGLAGTRSCSSLFQFPGLAPISYARKRSGEEGQFPSCISSPCRQGWNPTFR